MYGKTYINDKRYLYVIMPEPSSFLKWNAIENHRNINKES